MAIISVSIGENLLKEIDSVSDRMGFSGRSEVIRAGLRMLLAEEKENSKLKGAVEGVIIVTNEEKNNQAISDIRHKYNDIIRTQIHSHLESHRCLQVFIVSGAAEKIILFLRELKTCRKAELIKSVLA